jgi:hypothetical protein
VTFYDKCADVLGSNSQENLYSLPESLEDCAHFLQKRLNYLTLWRGEVPAHCQTPRRKNGSPYSTDFTPLDITASQSQNINRGCVLLECRYHNINVELHRPFINFSQSSPGGSSPLAEQCARTCALHAIALAKILHQVMQTTDLLDGQQLPARWLWNSSLALLGFILAQPSNSLAAEARKTVGSSNKALDRLSSGNDFAARAAKAARDLRTKVDNLIGEAADASIDTSIVLCEGGLSGTCAPIDPVDAADTSQMLALALPDADFLLAETNPAQVDGPPKQSRSLDPMYLAVIEPLLLGGNASLPAWGLDPGREAEMFLPWLPQSSDNSF